MNEPRNTKQTTHSPVQAFPSGSTSRMEHAGATNTTEPSEPTNETEQATRTAATEQAAYADASEQATQTTATEQTASSEAAAHPMSNFLFILWAGGAALLSYSLVYALRKPFTAATFDGLTCWGIDYKVAATLMQIAGYLVSKFFAIRLVSELKRENRLKFIIASVALAELALIAFGCLPCPANVYALFFNGLALGGMWGIIFSFIEGRRLTDILASLLGVSMAVSSGFAKSLGLYVVQSWQVSEFWMPALIGGLAFPLLVGMGMLLNRLPAPTAQDRALRSERVTLNKAQRRQLFRRFQPLLILLFCANLFITLLRDIKEDFLVNIIDMSHLSSWLFAQVDGMVTLIILGMFALMSLIRSNYRVLQVLLFLVIGAAATLSYLAFCYDVQQLPVLYWLFAQSLCLYLVYLSFQTLFFERFIACFRIQGNVGFFIATIDFVGYTGTVCVLLFKEFASPHLEWMHFYNQLSGGTGLLCCAAFLGALCYLMHFYRLHRNGWHEGSQPTEATVPEKNAPAAPPSPVTTERETGIPLTLDKHPQLV